MTKYLYWSFITGEFFTVLEDEIDTLTPFQIRIKNKPKSNCKQCYGRFFIGKNTNTGLYIICNKCKSKCIDYEALIDTQMRELDLTK